MRKVFEHFLITILILVPAALMAQRDSTGFEQLKPVKPAPVENIHLRTYRKARSMGDQNTAIVALNYFLAESPGNGFYRDTLSLLYLQAGKPELAEKYATETIRSAPKNRYARGILAMALESQSKLPEALRQYEILAKDSPGLFDLYQVASLRYRLERVGECRTAVESLLADPDIGKEQVRIFAGKKEMIVPMKAAVLNLRGNLELLLNKQGSARKSFKAALEIAPEFSLAKENLRAMRQANMDWEERNDR